jgi:hypothetical protein
MTTVRIVSLVAAALALSGCYIDLGDGSERTPEDWADTPVFEESAYEDPYTYGDLTTFEIDRTTLRGDMGAVNGFDGGIYEVRGEGYEGYTTVTVHSQSRGAWAVMGQLNVQGGLENLVPGARLTFDNAAYGYGGDGTEMFISMLGCSGPEPSVWEFDQYAERVDVQVGEAVDPGRLEVRFQARFAGYDYTTGAPTAPQIVDGSFSFTRP